MPLRPPTVQASGERGAGSGRANPRFGARSPTSATGPTSTGADSRCTGFDARTSPIEAAPATSSAPTRAASRCPRSCSTASPGDILVIKAGEVHGFTAIGDEPLVQLDVHLSPQFIQENLGW